MIQGRRACFVAVIGLLLTLAGCGWTYPGYDAAETRYNAAESTITASNVSQLREQWRAPGTEGELLVDKGRVYTTLTNPGGSSADDQLVAYDLGGNTGCSGSPKACAPLLSFGDPGCGCLKAGFAIADDIVFRWVGDATTPFGIAAFDAKGSTNCDAQTHRCQPLRTYPIPQVQDPSFTSGVSTPVVVDGVLYVATISADRNAGVLLAFDAHGVQSCTSTPIVCSPIRTASLPSNAWSTPAIADGVAYLRTYTGIAAVDISGARNCTGTAPVVCTALWVSSGTTPLGLGLAGPAVANGRVYVSNSGRLQVYDAHGVVGCTSGVCTPMWSAAPSTSAASGIAAPLIMNNRAYVAQGAANLVAYDANGVTGCHGTPLICDPLNSATNFMDLLGVTGANGLVVTNEYQDIPHGAVQIYGPALGTTPLWTESDPTLNQTRSNAIIADGKLIVSMANNESVNSVTLVVYGLG